MRSVLERIHRDYPEGEHILEINVLDGSGDNFLVFSGELRDLTDKHFTKVLRNARCFYLFTVLGIEKHLVESMNLHQHHISIYINIPVGDLQRINYKNKIFLVSLLIINRAIL